MVYSSPQAQGWGSIQVYLTFGAIKAFGKPIHRLSIWAKALSIWQRQNCSTHLLKKWSETLPNLKNGAFVFTSNVDGEFQKIGFEDDQVFECHGSIHWLQCLDNCTQDIWSAEKFEPVVDEEYCQLTNDFPTCPHCGGMARPNILMFSDWHWQSQMQDEKEQKLIAWLKQVKNLAIVELGAGTAVPSVRNFSERLINHPVNESVSLLRVNLREPQVPDKLNCYGIDLGALEVLIDLEKKINV